MSICGRFNPIPAAPRQWPLRPGGGDAIFYAAAGRMRNSIDMAIGFAGDTASTAFPVAIGRNTVADGVSETG